MIPERRPDEVLDDLALDIDQGRDRLSILAVEVGQEACYRSSENELEIQDWLP